MSLVNEVPMFAALKQVMNRPLASSRCMACVLGQSKGHQLARHIGRKLNQVGGLSGEVKLARKVPMANRGLSLNRLLSLRVVRRKGDCRRV
jgi:hypothetical protein